jgi:PPOX class probable F420-dependent enzyme
METNPVVDTSTEMEKVERARNAALQSQGSAKLSPGLLTLLREAAYCQVATLMPDGSPQITQVWVDTDGEHILVNTAEARQKTRNVRRDPRVAINVIDPQNGWRLATIRGRVIEITTDGADAQIDRLAKKYLGVDSYPFRRPDETRVMMVIEPEHVHEIGLEQEA